MELDLVLTPEDENLEAVGLSSPMGGKHQRDLSLSAKWASSKALALEYLQRQREAILWIESVLERKLPRDLFEALRSGIVLRELLVKLYPEPTAQQCLSPISRRYSLTMAPWKERENISIFLKRCKSMGMNDTFLFCTDDLYEGTNMVQVLFSIQHFMAFSREKSRYLFKPIAQESITFSNQELEMALSKIEQAGVDVNALLTSASSSPAKPDTEGNAATSDDVPSTVSCTSDADAVELMEDQEPTEEMEEDSVEYSEEEEEEEVAAALDVLELELHDHEVEDNNDFDEEEASDVELIFLESAEEELLEEGEPHDLKLESQLPDLENEDDDMAVLHELAEATIDAESFVFAAAELDDSILLLEIMDEMLHRIEQSVDTSLTDVIIATSQMVEALIPSNIEIVRLSSAELTDKNDTYVGDSLAPTVADTNVAAGAETPANKFVRAARASKKASKAGEKKPRTSSNEPLDVEAMSKCTCGSKCTIM